MAEDQGIIEWYTGRTLLLTGGTGFMGKVLLEKLLRVCPEIRRIYILIRAKRGFAPAARISEMTKLPVSRCLILNYVISYFRFSL